MSTISPNSPILTLISVLAVAPEHQQELVDIIVKAVNEYLRSAPGFISSNIHRSLDGTRVITYTQWKDRASFDAILQDSRGIKYSQAVLKLTTPEPHIYEVFAVIEAAPELTEDSAESAL